MKNRSLNNAKVGFFVMAGLAFLILTLYMIGKNRNLLGSTFTIKAVVTNVNGLVPGNNVRFKGIDVGTVKSLSVENDTAIIVTMMIDKKIKPFLRKNAVASIGTDGLMGNKLININSQAGDAAFIEEGDVILSLKPVETDEMLRTLNTTNQNIEKITGNLYEITLKLNSSQSLWTLLSDTIITQDLKKAVFDFRKAGEHTSDLTNTARSLVVKWESSDGLAQRLFTDTTLSRELSSSLEQIQLTTKKTSLMMDQLETVVNQMKQGEGTAGLILSDTLLREKLFKSAINVEQGTDRFNQNMEALKSNFLFRRYFRKLEKEQKNTTKAKKD
jgi:phospholipid/cholesterol/gamma-HCH transport system substrate-binding protein